jgi:hypothetical protein
MPRTFRWLAWFAALFMLATILWGLSLRMVDIRDRTDATAQRLATVHRLLGTAAAMLIVFVNSLVVTYFIGTARWVKEVAEPYKLDADLVARAQKLKRGVFPFALIHMLMAVGVAALGAASDPAARLRLQPPGGLSWTTLHLLAACAGLCLLVWGSLQQAVAVRAQHELINKVLQLVATIRRARGLE